MHRWQTLSNGDKAALMGIITSGIIWWVYSGKGKLSGKGMR